MLSDKQFLDFTIGTWMPSIYSVKEIIKAHTPFHLYFFKLKQKKITRVFQILEECVKQVSRPKKKRQHLKNSIKIHWLFPLPYYMWFRIRFKELYLSQTIGTSILICFKSFHCFFLDLSWLSFLICFQSYPCISRLPSSLPIIQNYCFSFLIGFSFLSLTR